MQKRGDSLKNILQKGQANIHAVARKREEPNLCIPPPPPLLDIFTPREKSSPRAKIRSRNRRSPAIIPSSSRRRYFVTLKQFCVPLSVLSLLLFLPSSF